MAPTNLDLFAGRNTTALDILWQDIDTWSAIYPNQETDKRTVIGHHIREFVNYAQQILTDVAPQDVSTFSQSEDGLWDRAEFNAIVVGILTAQWGLIRNVAWQRIPNHPYQGEVEKLDAEAQCYYHTLRNTILNVAPEAGEALLPMAPLVHLGALSELTIFNQDKPLFVEVPFGALYDENSRLAMAHEVGHALLVQFPALLDEIKESVGEARRGTDTDTQSKVITRVLLNWTEEIVADLLGTMLAEEPFTRSAAIMLASSKHSIGVTGPKHPPATIRPIVHSIALTLIQNTEFLQERAVKIESIDRQTQVDPQAGMIPIDPQRLDRRFRSLPALLYLSLAQVRQALETYTHDLLLVPLPSLGGMPFGNFLLACHQGKIQDPKTVRKFNQLRTWSELGDDFVLEIFHNMPPEFATPTPGIFRRELCKIFEGLPWCSG